MPWLRLWYRPFCSASSDTEVVETYEYTSNTPSTPELLEWARELVPNWVERFDHGGEVVQRLPEEARLKLIEKYSKRKAHADSMLTLLGYRGRSSSKSR